MFIMVGVSAFMAKVLKVGGSLFYTSLFTNSMEIISSPKERIPECILFIHSIKFKCVKQ